MRISRTALTAAIVISLAAIPLLWWAGATDQELAREEPAAAETSSATDALGTLGGAFVSRDEIPMTPIEDVLPEPLEPGRFVIAVPRTRTDTATGWATFRSTFPSSDICAVRQVPYGREVRITNTNNGRSIECRAGVAVFGTDADVVIHTDAFLQIAQLSAAPIPVQIDW
jgi:hypothetical protein